MTKSLTGIDIRKAILAEGERPSHYSLNLLLQFSAKFPNLGAPEVAIIAITQHADDIRRAIEDDDFDLFNE